MNPFNPIAIIPHYNHAGTIGNVAQKLIELGLPVLIVDDGSSAEQVSQLKKLETELPLQIVYCSQNGGKGAAMKVGFRTAFAQGFSHALQVDADGQHCLDDAKKMLDKARQNPEMLICGKPVYGNDAPKARLYGRKLTNFWIAINTLSNDIADGMCGFRLYPLPSTVKLIEEEYIGERMDFDIDILVRLHWCNIPMFWVDTPVKYEEGGISHFRGFADNWLISKMHAKLFFLMLWRKLTGKTV